MGRGRTRQRATPSTRDRILDASLHLFAQKGFVGTTTKDIARKARVNEVTLFRVFGTKRAMFAATIAERSPIIEIEKTVSFDADQPVEELLLSNARSVLSILRDNRDLFMMILGDAWRMPRLRTVISESGVERGIEMVAGLMQALIDAGKIRDIDPHVAARAMVGMVQAYFITVDLLAGRTPNAKEDEKMLKGFVTVFLDGVRTEVRG